jgi:hypothetical protein
MINFSSTRSLPEVDTFLMMLLSQSSLGMEKPISLTIGTEKDEVILLKFQEYKYCKFQKKIFSLEIKKYSGNLILGK